MKRFLENIGLVTIVILVIGMLAVTPALFPDMRLPDGRKASEFGR